GGDLVHALKKIGPDNFFGTGGESMRREGVEILEDIESMNVVGFIEALKHYSRLKKLAVRLVAEAVKRGSTLAILIDYPGFNLRIATMLREKGISVIYLVSPQIWAWHYSRVKRIKEDVSLMLPLFPFEKEIYDSEGVPAQVVGHPLVFRIGKRLKEEEPVAKATRGVTTIGLLPGSRRSEVRNLLPDMLKAAELLKTQIKKVRFLMPAVSEDIEAMIKAGAAEHPGLPLEILRDRSLAVMQSSDVVILASGTATLETAWFEKPMVILYRVSALNLLIGTLVMRTRFIGMVNLLARRQVAPELLQAEVSPENIARETLRILQNAEHRTSVVRELQYVKRQLGAGNPAAKAAKAIQNFLDSRSAPARKKRNATSG
ncbi:MAG: lipid-A-disaccharide synthase, partial [Spirochaetia bacterium]|nr:lipid-A-disaccharide synthase [Spirochaetia bacterium]